jgi:hypothetical protein
MVACLVISHATKSKEKVSCVGSIDLGGERGSVSQTVSGIRRYGRGSRFLCSEAAPIQGEVGTTRLVSENGSSRVPGALGQEGTGRRARDS